MGKIRRALISVSDKTGIVEFAYGLKRFGINILSTGGTAKLLRDNGVNVRDVSDYTGFPEMFEGRIKTLHPLIHGGILHKRDNPEHVQLARKHGMLPFDMVVVNLYPFQQTVARTDCTIEDAIENIDIGGSAMLRSAAKNNRDVTVLVDPRDYAEVLTEMAESDGSVSEDTNFRLATAAFLHTGKYDLAINNYLETICLEK